MKKIFVIIILFFVVGCSNTIKYIQNVEESTKEKSAIIKNVIRDDNNNAGSDESLIYNFEANEVKTSTLVNEKYAINTEQFTPYQGGREFYEFFVGVIGIPVSVVGNVFDFVLFGAIPNELLNKQFYATFSGLNPAINIESEKRSEFKETLRSLTDSKEEEVKKITPLSGKSVKVCINEVYTDSVDSDEFGKITIDMFTILSRFKLNEEPRKITVYMNPSNNDFESDDKLSCDFPGETSITKYFNRDMAYKLFDANKELYYLKNTPDISPQRAAKSIYVLSNVGFEQWSMRAEDETRYLKKDDEEFFEAFSEEVKSLFELKENESEDEMIFF